MIPHSKPYISQEDIEAVSKQVSSGMHATGNKTKEFEEKISELIGTKFAKATTSGTTALHLALLSLNIKQGDEVIIPSYVCQSLLNAINHVNAKPIFADIQNNFLEKGFNISYETIKPLIIEKTKAIILPHMFGVPANVEKIKSLNIPIIEDCAQSLGAECNGKKVGSIGDIGVFSFYATKVISTGQGGMITTNSEKIKNKIQDLTTYDKKENYTTGYNHSLTDIQSSLGISQLKKLPEFINRRKKIIEKYEEAFKNTKLKLPSYPEGTFAFRYVIQLENKEQRKLIQEKLKQKNIIAEQPVFKPLHQYLGLNKNNFPNTELAHNTTLSLPCYPSLSDEEVERVIEIVKNFR